MNLLTYHTIQRDGKVNASALIANGSFESGITYRTFGSIAAFQENKACLYLPGSGIGRNGSLPSAVGFTAGFRDKAILVILFTLSESDRYQ
jgi:hypothetical protein